MAEISKEERKAQIEATKARRKLIKDTLQDQKSLTGELVRQVETAEGLDKVFNKVFGIRAKAMQLEQDMKKALEDNNEQSFKDLQTKLAGVRASQNQEESIKATLAPLTGMVSKANAFKAALLANPAIALLAVLAAIVKVAIDLGKATLETRKELGLSLVESAKLTAQTEILGFKAKVFGGTVEDIKQAQTAIRNELGLSVREAANLSFQFAKTAAVTGQSEEQLAGTLSLMESISSASREALLAQIETTGEILQQKGLAPGDIFKDVADNAENFASFAKDGGANIFAAAASAKKLGLNMSNVASATESLLDFETSIEKQLEASLLLGRQINLDRARQLALTGDQEGLLEEVRRQVGDEAEFNRLNVVQRKALADAFGLQVEQVARAVRGNTAAVTGAAAAGSDDFPRQQIALQEDANRKLDKLIGNTE